jgi:hypothetical protein
MGRTSSYGFCTGEYVEVAVRTFGHRRLVSGVIDQMHNGIFYLKHKDNTATVFSTVALIGARRLNVSEIVKLKLGGIVI